MRSDADEAAGRGPQRAAAAKGTRRDLERRAGMGRAVLRLRLLILLMVRRVLGLLL